MLWVKPIVAVLLFVGDNTVVVAMLDDLKMWQEHCYTLSASMPNSNRTKGIDSATPEEMRSPEQRKRRPFYYAMLL